jgi:hypothetical protein
MSFNNFAELQDLIRSYNSKSILEIGTGICYKIFYNQNNSDPLIYLLDNAKRGYAIRIMLLASMGNPHRIKNIDEISRIGHEAKVKRRIYAIAEYRRR